MLYLSESRERHRKISNAHLSFLSLPCTRRDGLGTGRKLPFNTRIFMGEAAYEFPWLNCTALKSSDPPIFAELADSTHHRQCSAPEAFSRLPSIPAARSSLEHRGGTETLPGSIVLFTSLYHPHYLENRVNPVRYWGSDDWEESTTSRPSGRIETRFRYRKATSKPQYAIKVHSPSNF